MTTEEARRIVQEFRGKSLHAEEEIFLYTEALGFLIEEEKNPHDMMALGGWYYEQRDFDLALKYYEMASACDLDSADMCLGYIWYYGRTGERDYERAFHHFSRSMERGNPISTYKVADMYKNGYYVDRDEKRYQEIIEGLYPQMCRAQWLSDPVPEVFTRLAKIRVQQGKTGEAVELYRQARDFLAQRLLYSTFFGDLNIMHWLIDDLYALVSFDPRQMDLFDLYHVLQRPARVSFYRDGKRLEVESLIEDGTCVTHFGEHWYRDVDGFFQRAVLGEKHLSQLSEELYGFTLQSGGEEDDGDR